jgi:prophage regulatory protein
MLAQRLLQMHYLGRGQTDSGSVCMEVSEDRFIKIASVIQRTGRSRAAIYRMVADGTFPKQERIGVRAVAWRLSAVLKWMDAPLDYRCDP